MAIDKLTPLETRLAKKISSTAHYTEREAARCAQRIIRNLRSGRQIGLSALAAA